MYYAQRAAQKDFPCIQEQGSNGIIINPAICTQPSIFYITAIGNLANSVFKPQKPQQQADDIQQLKTAFLMYVPVVDRLN